MTNTSPASSATQDSTVETADAEVLYVQEEEIEAEDFLDKVDIEEELVTSSTTEKEATEEVTSVSAESVRSIDAAAVSFPPQCPEVQLLRIAPPAYHDGISELAGQNRLGARDISNQVLAQSGSIPSQNRESDMLWQWGQFVDHDIDLTEMTDESEPIPVPLGDPFFDPMSMGGKTIAFERSEFDPATGTDPSNPRQQVNQITGFIDASNVYGCDDATAQSLRTLDGTGKLKVSAGNLLPRDPNGFFLAGDIRVNEQVALSSMHTLWMREHNFWARRLRNRRPSMTGDDIYEAARNVVMAEMQIITYQDFLPKLLGGAIGSYNGFDPSVDPRIANEFSTAAYRLGHTMLSGVIQRLNADGTPIAAGPLALRDAFFVPSELVNVGVAPYMKGLASQVMQRIDSKIVDDVRNFLFDKTPADGGLDLGSLNIQRGRDHGLPDYNSVRIAYGLAPVASFADITGDTTVQQQLFNAYGNVNDIDVWVGALAEDPVPGTLVGELLHAALVDQFTRLREGDIDWYENRLNPGAARSLENQTLAKVIARNTPLLRSDLQADVFIVP